MKSESGGKVVTESFTKLLFNQFVTPETTCYSVGCIFFLQDLLQI